jgi:hypothetical protein
VSKEVTAWYEGFIAQVEHWYTRRAQAISLVIALVAAAAFNVDTMRIGRELYASSALRDQAVAGAAEINGSPAGRLCGTPDQPTADPAKCLKYVEATFPVPLGWGDNRIEQAFGQFGEHSTFDLGQFGQLLLTIIGITMSGLAISLGSRFWFDTLKTVLSLRTGGQPAPATSTPGDKPGR